MSLTVHLYIDIGSVETFTLTPCVRLTDPLIMYVGVAPNAQSACDFVNFVRLTAKNYQAIVLSMC